MNEPNAVLLVIIEAADQPGVYVNDFPVYVEGEPSDAEDVVRAKLAEQTTKSGPWINDFLKAIVVKGIESYPFTRENI